MLHDTTVSPAQKLPESIKKYRRYSSSLMLGSFVRSLVCVVYLLASDVSGKVLDGHDTGKNCSAILNVSSSLHDGKPAECPPWFTQGNQTGDCRAGPTLNGII
ncbi:hypothetical protein GBAR_LOCUS12877, partial [Geodia barretti]